MDVILEVEKLNFINKCETYIKRVNFGFKESFTPLLIHNVLLDCVANKEVFSPEQYGNIISYLSKFE